MTPEPPDLPPPLSVTATLAADAAGAQATTPHSAHAHSAGNTHCLNCGTPLTGPFCSACGQHDFDFHRSFRHVFMEALESILHFDGKFFQNLVTLLFRPGRLTADFNAGKRASQVPPFRLYIFTAFVFFLVLAATSSTDVGNDSRPDRKSRRQATTETAPPPPAATDENRGTADSAAITTAHPGSPDFVEEIKSTAEQFQREMAARQQKRDAAAAADAAKAGKPPRQRSDLELWAENQGQRSLDPAFRRELGQKFMSALPKMLLLCLPAFALLTRVLFRKSGQVYLQHLVLAVHYHTFIYIFVMFRDGWVFVADSVGLVSLGVALEFAAKLWLVAYPVLMLRHLFRNSWLKTLLKTGLLALTYSLLLALAFFATAAVLFLMM